MTIKAGTVIFSGTCADTHMEEAKLYIKKFGLTFDDVALRKNMADNSVYIIAKRDLDLCEKVQS